MVFVFCMYPTKSVPSAGPDCWPEPYELLGTTKFRVPRVFSAKLRAQSMMMFHASQSQHWQPLLPVTACSSHCIPSLMLGQYWCDCSAEGTRNSSAPQIARVGHEEILIWDLFPAWIAGGQTLDICSSTTVEMKIEVSCHFSVTNMQKYIHPNEDWHCLYG